MLSRRSDTKVAPLTYEEEERVWEEDCVADYSSRETMIARIHRDDGKHTAYELRCFELGLELEKKVASMAARTPFKTKHSQLQASTSYDTKEDVLCGHVECIIRAPVVDVLAFYMDFESRLWTKYERGPTTLDFKTLEVKNAHHHVTYWSFRVPPPFQPREFIAAKRKLNTE